MTPQTRQWMGGNVDGQWANHYELLGLPLGWDDTATVVRIANELLSRIQDATQPENASQLNTVTEAIRQAQACLTDPAAKAAYDRQLTNSAIGHASSAANDIPDAIPVAIPMEPASTNVPLFETRRKTPVNLRRERRSRFWLTAGSAVLGTIMFGGLALLGRHFLIVQPRLTIANNENPTTHEAPTEIEKTSEGGQKTKPIGDVNKPKQVTDVAAETASRLTTPPKPPLELPDQHERSAAHSVFDAVETEALPPTAVPTPKPLTSEELQTLSNALIRVRSALMNKQFQQANDALAAAKTTARHPHHIRLVDELSELTHYTQEYWAGLDDAWADLSAGNELAVGTSRVNIVEIDQRRIILRVAGSNRPYKRSELPVGLHQAIMDGWLDGNSAVTNLIQGAYHATKEPAETDKARAAWQQASRLGGQTDLLLPTLDATYDVERLRQLESEP